MVSHVSKAKTASIFWWKWRTVPKMQDEPAEVYTVDMRRIEERNRSLLSEQPQDWERADVPEKKEWCFQPRWPGLFRAGMRHVIVSALRCVALPIGTEKDEMSLLRIQNRRVWKYVLNAARAIGEFRRNKVQIEDCEDGISTGKSAMMDMTRQKDSMRKYCLHL